MAELKLPSEHAEQVQVVSWFNIQYPKLRGCLFSIPNGAHLAGNSRVRAIKMKKMKAEGFKNGVSDLFLAVPNNGKAGLFVEMKPQKKTKCSVSKDQKAHIELMVEMGYSADWAPGSAKAIEIIKTYLF